MANRLKMTRTLLTGLFKSKLSVTAEARVPMKVGLGDLDLNLHLTNSRYLQMMDIGRTDLLLRNGLAGAAWSLRANPVVGGAAIRFKAEMRFGTEFELVSRMIGWDDKWFFCQQSFRVDERDRAVGLVKLLFHRGKEKFAPATILRAHRDGDVESPIAGPSLASWADENGL